MFKKSKLFKKVSKNFLLLLLVFLIILAGLCFYKYREGFQVNRVGIAKGGWGGSCTCPDGQVYQVSDNNSYGKELACYGGISGKVNKFSGPWSGKSVTCAPKAKSSGLKDYIAHSENTKLPESTNNNGGPPEAPGCYILLPEGCPKFPSYDGWTAKKNTWQLDQPWVLSQSGKNKQICDKRAQDFNAWCNIKDAKSFFRA